MTKIEQFVKRNRKRNAHLYVDGLVEGFNFIVCPVTGARLSMIKSTYIVNVLGMTIEEYDRLYPRKRKISQARQNNIKQGLQVIDPTTGLTKYEVSQIKSRELLITPDENGITGYKKKGQKTRATHMSKIDQHGKNGYRRQADARLTTILSNGLTVEQNAHQKQKASLAAKGISRVVGASKISKKNLKSIIDYLDQQSIKYYFDKYEYGILDTDTNNYYYYDLTIPELSITVEYQSSAWHSNPSWDDNKWNSWYPPKGRKKTANESILYDYTKAKSLFKHRKIVTYYVWEDSLNTDIKGILCLLQTMIMKS